MKIKYISISFQQTNLPHYFYLPLLRPLPSGKVYQGMSRTRTQGAGSWRTHPQKLSFLSSRGCTSIPSPLWPQTLQTICLNYRTLPPIQPLVPLEKIQALPPAPALHHGLARNRTGIRSARREFLLSLRRLRLPSKASSFACDFAI